MAELLRVLDGRYRTPETVVARRLAVATAVDKVAGTVTVNIGGDTTVPVDVPYAACCVPSVGDTLVLDVVAGAGLAIAGQPDRWHTIGAGGEPAFAGTWAVVGANRKAGFRRTDDGGVELAGWLLTTTATAAPNTIFTLPAGWRPDAAITIGRTAGNSGGTQVATSINISTAGLVQLTAYAGSVQWGNVGLDGIRFALTGPA
jgi:hypothetical protein